MTIDELNALYEATDFGNNANYKAPSFDGEFQEKILPVDTPYIDEPIVKQLGTPYNDNDGGIKALAGMDYGYDSVFDNTNITPTRPDGTLQPQTNFEYDIGEGTIPQEDIDNNKTSGIAGLLELLQKISPMANIMKLGKTGIETAQKYFADKKETERLEALAQIEQARKQKEAQAIIAAAEEKSKQIAANRIQAANEQNRTGGYQAGYGSDFMGGGDRGTGMGAADKGGSDSMGSFARGGRTGYGTGGIVTL